MLDLSRLSPARSIALGLGLAWASSTAAFAQDPGRDPAPSWLEQRVTGVEQKLAFLGARDAPDTGASNVEPAQSSMADVAVRLDRIENQMRTLNGRLEQLEYQSKKNDEGLKRFQGDVDYRFQDIENGKGGGGAKPAKRGDLGDSGPSTASTDSSRGGPAGGPSGPGAPPSSLGGGRGNADAIGGLIDGPGDDPNGPMRISPPGVGRSTAGGDDGGGRMADRGPPPTVTAGSGGARDQFDLGVGFIQRGDYGQAEATFRDFLRTYPKDAKAPEAQYWLGESLYQRKKYTDAAESFLAIYNSAPQSAKAPESMLKLGMSLNGMGQKEQACAAIAEAGKKYARIKPQSDRELKRIAC
ncbi:tol-pal system protein YbgF [Hansschlegelia plantiphila]|uniref:Cell division coordinator CpoB n=1 Tax=Hansschlegelia plantiphila TaxID=374655 RepID=A0A9W6J4X5_9HYPH|nr:tol-pal system protein YbgF [Hansschlegelia plantiphila]GLK69338.1 tol-pal system protein YbgF [Hansschlegelia plantiphila]